jgi:hypothetical protein
MSKVMVWRLCLLDLKHLETKYPGLFEHIVGEFTWRD